MKGWMPVRQTESAASPSLPPPYREGFNAKWRKESYPESKYSAIPLTSDP
jgi:hypothetical protein